MTEDEIVGWHHRLIGHEFEQGLGVGDGQGSLAYCSPWAHKELDKTEQQSSNNTHIYVYICCCYDDAPVTLHHVLQSPLLHRTLSVSSGLYFCSGFT